jgi:D-galactonate transporter
MEPLQLTLDEAGKHKVADHADPDATFRKITWRLIPILVFVFILAWLDRVNVGFAKLSMAQDLQFSDAVYGFGAGIFFIGYFLFEVPSNLLMARIGARKTLARITLLWGVVSIAMLTVQTPLQFYTLRFLLGVCEAGFFPGVILYLTYWFPPSRRAKANGLFMTSFAIAGVIGGPLAGWIMNSMRGVAPFADWQWLFLLEGIPSVITGCLLLFLLPERPESVNWLSDAQKALIRETLDRESAQNPHTTHLREAMKDKRLWFCAAIFFCLVAGNATLAFWVPSIIRDIGVQNVLNIGLLSAIPFFAGTLAMVCNASHSDYSRERRWHCAVPALIAATGFALTALSLGNSVLAVMAMTLSAIGVLGAMPIFWSFPATFLAGTAAAGGIALINCIANLAGFVAPYAIGYLRTTTGSVASGLLFVAALQIAAALMVLLVFRAAPSSSAGQAAVHDPV